LLPSKAALTVETAIIHARGTYFTFLSCVQSDATVNDKLCFHVSNRVHDLRSAAKSHIFSLQVAYFACMLMSGVSTLRLQDVSEEEGDAGALHQVLIIMDAKNGRRRMLG
jgi:hypothetical protein